MGKLFHFLLLGLAGAKRDPHWPSRGGKCEEIASLLHRKNITNQGTRLRTLLFLVEGLKPAKK